MAFGVSVRRWWVPRGGAGGGERARGVRRRERHRASARQLKIAVTETGGDFVHLARGTGAHR
jgi:hypothetical protein